MNINKWDEFTFLMTALFERLKLPLPGLEAQLKRAPAYRAELLRQSKFKDNPRQSAVLILLYPDDSKINTVFIQRNVYDGVHSGQIAFPGGRMEPDDPDLIYTALREAQEEIGILQAKVNVLGSLTSLYIPPSNFDVLPVVAYSMEVPEFIPQISEVSGYFSISIDQLASFEACQEREVVLNNGTRYHVPCFVVNEQIIWGATSMIINEFLEVWKDINKENPL